MNTEIVRVFLELALRVALPDGPIEEIMIEFERLAFRYLQGETVDNILREPLVGAKLPAAELDALRARLLREAVDGLQFNNMQLLLWYSFIDVDDHRWVVYLAHPSHPGLKNRKGRYYGFTEFSTHTILINAEHSRVVQNATLLHELMHVACKHKSKKLSDGAEELAIETMTDPLYRYVRDLGFEPFPRPAGARALEESAVEWRGQSHAA